MKNIDFGELDIFAVPMSLNATKNSGSIPGLVMTITYITLIIMFLAYSIADMIGCTLDKYDSQTMAVDFHHEDTQPKYLKDFKFLPSIKIDLLDDSEVNRKEIA